MAEERRIIFVRQRRQARYEDASFDSECERLVAPVRHARSSHDQRFGNQTVCELRDATARHADFLGKHTRRE
jgi:hypothetical protein